MNYYHQNNNLIMIRFEARGSIGIRKSCPGLPQPSNDTVDTAERTTLAIYWC